MSYILSENIKVFPCSNRPKYIEDRWLTEYNLVNIINRLVDRDKFVVTTTWITASENDSEFMFNINGYLFTTTQNALISKIDDLKDSVTVTQTSKYYLVATIITKSEIDTSPYLSLDLEEGESEENGLDITIGEGKSEFRGVKFQLYTKDQLKSLNNNSLTILAFNLATNKEVTDFNIPIESKIKFETNQSGSRSVSIDDGEL